MDLLKVEAGIEVRAPRAPSKRWWPGSSWSDTRASAISRSPRARCSTRPPQRPSRARPAGPASRRGSRAAQARVPTLGPPRLVKKPTLVKPHEAHPEGDAPRRPPRSRDPRARAPRARRGAGGGSRRRRRSRVPAEVHHEPAPADVAPEPPAPAPVVEVEPTPAPVAAPPDCRVRRPRLSPRPRQPPPLRPAPRVHRVSPAASCRRAFDCAWKNLARRRRPRRRWCHAAPSCRCSRPGASCASPSGHAAAPLALGPVPSATASYPSGRPVGRHDARDDGSAAPAAVAAGPRPACRSPAAPACRAGPRPPYGQQFRPRPTGGQRPSARRGALQRMPSSVAPGGAAADHPASSRSPRA